MVPCYKSMRKNLNLSLGFDWSEDPLECEKTWDCVDLLLPTLWVALPAVAVKSSKPRQGSYKGLSEVSVWPCHACTYLASFTWTLACCAEQAAVFSDIPPALTKKKSYSWPSNSDFCSYWCFCLDTRKICTSFSKQNSTASFLLLYSHFPSMVFWPRLHLPSEVHAFSAQSSLHLSHLHKDRKLPQNLRQINTCLMLSLSLLRGYTQGVALPPSACVTPMAPQGFQKENDMWIKWLPLITSKI